MRTTILELALLASSVGCSAPGKVQPAPPPIRDHKTPVALQKPCVSQRITEQRRHDAEMATGDLAVEGGLRR